MNKCLKESQENTNKTKTKLEKINESLKKNPRKHKPGAEGNK